MLRNLTARYTLGVKGNPFLPRARFPTWKSCRSLYRFAKRIGGPNLKADIATIKTDLGGIQKDVKETLSDALRRAYPVQPNGAKKIGNLELGNKSLELANSFRVTLDPVLVNNLAQDAIRLAGESVKLQPTAWKSVQLSLSQRTNQEELRAFINTKQWWEETNPVVLAMARDSGFRVLHSYISGAQGKTVPFEACAILGQIDIAETIWRDFWRDILNSHCPQYFRFVDGEIPPLDGAYLKNVVFENVHIVYSGGRTLLENVMFLNCSFDLSFNRQTGKFADLLLTTKEVTFTGSGPS